MCQPVQERPGEPLRSEDLGPLVEGEVRGDEDRPSLVALAEDLEEQFRLGGGQGDEAQLINDQQPEAGQLPLQVEQRSFVPGPPAVRFTSVSPARRPSGFPSQGGYLGFLRGYDHLKRGGWNVAQSVLVDVDTLDDFAVLGPVHDLVLRVLGFVQGQSQRFHRFHLLVVGETYAPKRVACIEHNTSEGARRRTKEGLAAARPGDAAAS